MPTVVGGKAIVAPRRNKDLSGGSGHAAISQNLYYSSKVITKQTCLDNVSMRF